MYILHTLLTAPTALTPTPEPLTPDPAMLLRRREHALLYALPPEPLTPEHCPRNSELRQLEADLGDLHTLFKDVATLAQVSACVSVCLCVCLSCLSVCVSVCLSVCLSACLRLPV